MKKMIVCLIAVSAFAFAASAQVERKNDNRPNAGRPGMRMQRAHMMMKKMNFSDAQKQQMKTINMDFKTKMEALEKNDNQTVKDYRAQKVILMQERKSKMDAVLTPEQKTQRESFKKEGQQKREEMSDKRLDKMKTNLGLTDDQLAQLKAQRETMKTKLETIKNNQSLTPMQKREQFKTLREGNKGYLKSILTPDQKKKIEEKRNMNNNNSNK